MAWLWFAVVQLLTLAAEILGWVVLLPFCLARAWKPATATVGPTTSTDTWSWGPLNWVYGNPSSDGVSGSFAKVWNGGAQVPYMATAAPWWRAYCWSGWRNTAGGLKYLFAWSNGPFVSGTWVRGREWKCGWQLENGVKVPVLSL